MFQRIKIPLIQTSFIVRNINTGLESDASRNSTQFVGHVIWSWSLSQAILQQIGQWRQTSLFTNTQRASNFEIVLAGGVAQVVVRGARVSDLAFVGGLTRRNRPTLAVDARPVGAAEATLGARVADGVVRAVLVFTAVLITPLVLPTNFQYIYAVHFFTPTQTPGTCLPTCADQSLSQWKEFGMPWICCRVLLSFENENKNTHSRSFRVLLQQNNPQQQEHGNFDQKLHFKCSFVEKRIALCTCGCTDAEIRSITLVTHSDFWWFCHLFHAVAVQTSGNYTNNYSAILCSNATKLVHTRIRADSRGPQVILKICAVFSALALQISMLGNYHLSLSTPTKYWGTAWRGNTEHQMLTDGPGFVAQRQKCGMPKIFNCWWPQQISDAFPHPRSLNIEIYWCQYQLEFFVVQNSDIGWHALPLGQPPPFLSDLAVTWHDTSSVTVILQSACMRQMIWTARLIRLFALWLFYFDENFSSFMYLQVAEIQFDFGGFVSKNTPIILSKTFSMEEKKYACGCMGCESCGELMVYHAHDVNKKALPIWGGE